jgi:hypothetical protein
MISAVIWKNHGTSVEAFVAPARRYSQTTRSTIMVAASQDFDDWFKQKRGESDINFIKRLTSQTPPKKEEPKTEPTKGYQRIEDWEAEQKELRKNTAMSWEERVQFEGLRHGNQLRQNDILMRQINSGL